MNQMVGHKPKRKPLQTKRQKPPEPLPRSPTQAQLSTFSWILVCGHGFKHRSTVMTQKTKKNGIQTKARIKAVVALRSMLSGVAAVDP
eukprot:CAMPEP_0181495226 /NCGR_PEP_ID=MMETSP1110-20121109/52253_1 /TAXON_ID=174948 /ORGANISM="Symbiodinium sp., Strain CCMP421" /LENGTH=87 /DNA_ID=CAMNT_0023622813 /DNA_START=178 /DNA_END=438 /DNA_ORIENTATION=-